MLILFLQLILSPAAPAAQPTLVGHWVFFEKVYDGQEMPEPPTATLRMHFEFTAGGESRLYWWHEGDTDHCSRRGRYSVDGNTLVDEVTWVDPQNTRDCSDDPDMQPGRRTRTPFYFRGDNLAIRFQLDGSSLDMVWKKVEEK
jgi:hypothetical protein